MYLHSSMVRFKGGKNEIKLGGDNNLHSSMVRFKVLVKNI